MGTAKENTVKLLKILLYLFSGIIALFLIIALAIQIPSVQNTIIDKATTYLSKKTNTKVSIDHFSLAFPGRIILQGIYLEDQKKDTLLYAGNIKVGIDLPALLYKEVNIDLIDINNLHASVYNTEQDSIMNYQFLIDAFTGPTKDTIAGEEAGEPMKISVEKVLLTDIHASYKDPYHQTTASVNLKNLQLRCREMDLEKLQFDLKELSISGLNFNADIATSGNSNEGESATLPKIKLDELNLENIQVSYSSDGDQILNAFVGSYQQQDIDADLAMSKIKSGKIELNDSKIVLLTYAADSTSDNSTSIDTLSTAWDVQVESLNLKNNSISIRESGATLSNYFNPAYIEATDLNLSSTDIIYNRSLTSIKLSSMSLNSGREFALRKLEGSFKMLPGGISAEQLTLITSKSNLQADLHIKYRSLETLSDSIGKLFVNADLKESYISVADILWLQPTLSKQPFLNNRNNYAAITGKLQGRVNDLKGDRIKIRSGRQTLLTSNFYIRGLPEIKNTHFSIPDLLLNTTAADITTILGKDLLPSNIQLPASIRASIQFKGNMEAFSNTTLLTTTAGSTSINLSMSSGNNYTALIKTKDVDLGYILKNPSLGPVTLTTEVNGSGLDTNTINAHVKVNAEKIFLNKYNYKNLHADVNINKQQYQGSVSVKDTNLDMEVEGLVNTAYGNEIYQVKLDVKGADLKQLHITQNDLRIGIKGEADLKGNQINTVNGKVAISQLIISKDANKYILDSLLGASINEKGRNKLDVSSSVINIQYNGTISLSDIGSELTSYVNNYFPVTTPADSLATKTGSNFTLTVQIKNHPIIREVFLPSLGAMDIDPITISFNSEEKKLDAFVHVNKLEYDSTSLSDVTINLNSNPNTIDYSVAITDMSNGQFRVTNFLLNGSASNGLATVNVAATNPADLKLLVLKTAITKSEDMYRVSIDPSEFVIAGKQWNVVKENYVAIGNEGFIVHNLDLTNNSQLLSVNSASESVKQDLNISLKNFSLDELSEIIKKDKKLVGGNINGLLVLKYSDKGYGIGADMQIDNLHVNEIPAGNLTLLASSESGNRYKLDAALKSDANDIGIKGYFAPADTVSNLDLKLDIRQLSMLTVQSIAPDQISESSGSMNGAFTIKGNTAKPSVNGTLHFSDVGVSPALLGSKIYIKDENLKLENEQLSFDDFSIRDENNEPLQISGTVGKLYDVPEFNLTVTSKNFQLMNSKAEQNKDYHGRVIIDSKIRITGTSNLPIVTSRIHLKKGTDFTIAIPEKKLSTDRGEDVVVFIDSLKFHPIITRNEEQVKERGEIKGLDITSTIEVDKEAVLRVLIDPSTNDSLVVQGDAALNFGIDPSGKTTLTGTYSLYDGSYIASLESLVRKKFIIRPGSTITWNGNPTDAELDITAVYTVRTSPIDLIANQVAGLSDADKNNYRMRIPFEVLLKMEGELTKPDISFEIQLPPAEKGVLGGAVNAQLAVLNEDESELNKQVFALLVLGRFVQQNPLDTESGSGVSTAARTSVSKFLTQQLNQLSSKVIKGVDVSFDVQSYEDYSTGSGEGRTELGVALEKRLFDERLSVQVGGSVDVEGEKSNQNNASDLTGDVTVEYMLTEDGRYRLKGFRHNQYEGVLEGQLVETGAGVVYSRDFNRWKNFLKLTKREKAKQKNEDSGSQD